MNEIMPVKINTNPNLKNWDYRKSVTTVKSTVINWKKASTELLDELFKARMALSKVGNPFQLTEDGVEKKKTWNDYCVEIGLNRRTVNRWIDRYLNPERDVETPVKEKILTHNILVQSVKKQKDGSYAIRFVCPECEQIHTMEVEID